MLIVGIDIAKCRHEATIINDKGDVLGASFSFPNSNAGALKLLDHILKQNKDGEEFVFGMEATGHYWLALYSYLVEHNFTVHVINPIQSNSLRKLYIRKTKNDSKDSFIIAEVIRFGRYTETQLSSEVIMALKQLTRFRFYLVDQSTEFKLKAIAILDQIFPEFERLFSDTFGVSARAIMETYTTPEEILKISTEDLATFLIKASHGTLRMPKAKQIKESAAKSFGITFATDAFAFELRQIIAEISFIEEQVKLTEEQIAYYYEQIDSHLESIPGVGMILAATIESEIGDISRFPDPSKVVAFAGIDPTVSQSGEFISNKNKMSKKGSPYLRRALWMAATDAALYDPAMKAYYDKKRAEGKHHMTAIGAVSRKLTYVIYALMRDKKDYVPVLPHK